MNAQTVERWSLHDIELAGPSGGNPFVDVRLRVDYQCRNRVVRVDGFYDGGGRYRARFMPDAVGSWTFRAHSNVPDLDGVIGAFVCTAATGDNHGPVRAAGKHHFEYADGERYLPFGTTCYHWTHGPDQAMQQQTLNSLRDSPFNKVRMCLLPTANMLPGQLAFAGETPETVDRTRFNPAFFAHLEQRIAELGALGIEADLILFHPYDEGFWGFANMTREEDERYLRYVVARLAAFRNVWWSLSNEYDFNHDKSVRDWDRLLQFVQRADPYQHLRSIHNGTKMYETFTPYDFSKTWITHQSIQHWDGAEVPGWRASCAKPVVIDEIGYEGDGPRRWGNLTGAELSHRFWQGFAGGGYVAHGECFTGGGRKAWMSGGGSLIGESVRRIAFLRQVMQDGPQDIPNGCGDGAYHLHYLGARQPATHLLDLPDGEFTVDVIDTWEMTVRRLPGTFRGRSRIELPQRQYIAVRAERVAS